MESHEGERIGAWSCCSILGDGEDEEDIVHVMRRE